MDICLHNTPQTMQDIRQAAQRLFQMHPAALNAAHIQHIINQADQMVAGSQYLFQVFQYLVFSVYMRDSQSCKTDNRVHRRTDIMRHIGKEHALCLVCTVRLEKSVLQQCSLFHFPACFSVNIAETQHDAPAAVP